MEIGAKEVVCETNYGNFRRRFHKRLISFLRTPLNLKETKNKSQEINPKRRKERKNYIFRVVCRKHLDFCSPFSWFHRNECFRHVESCAKCFMMIYLGNTPPKLVHKYIVFYGLFCEVLLRKVKNII